MSTRDPKPSPITPEEELCEDEGCPHFGTPHVCNPEEEKTVDSYEPFNEAGTMCPPDPDLVDEVVTKFPPPVDYEAEVKKVWPDAIQNRSFLSPYNYIVYDGDMKHGISTAILGLSKDSYKAAWQDAYSKLPAPSTTSEAANDVRVDEIVSGLYRRFKEWNKRGFGPEDVTWCEVKADVIALIAFLPPPTIGSEAALPPLDESIVLAIDELKRHLDSANIIGVGIMAVRPMVANNVLCGLAERERQLLAAFAKAPQAAPLDEPSVPIALARELFAALQAMVNYAHAEHKGLRIADEALNHFTQFTHGVPTAATEGTTE